MLRKLSVRNFTCFAEADFDFSPGLNVIVGPANSGKTHLLKLIYGLAKSFRHQDKKPNQKEYGRRWASSMRGLFRGNLGELTCGTCHVHAAFPAVADVHVSFGRRSVNHAAVERMEFLSGLERRPVFVPARDVLSVFPGLHNALFNRELDFDSTFMDICMSLGGAPLRNPSCSELEALGRLAGGQYVLQNDTFFCNGRRAGLLSEGQNRLGTIQYLLRNGEIGGMLFLDELDMGLKPGRAAEFGRLLLRMSDRMQIFATTRHKEFVPQGKSLMACFELDSQDGF